MKSMALDITGSRNIGDRTAYAPHKENTIFEYTYLLYRTSRWLWMMLGDKPLEFYWEHVKLYST